MKHIDVTHLLSKASDLPLIRQGRTYQHQVFVKMNEKATVMIHDLPEKIKMNIPSISVGVFDGEFEEQHSLLDQVKKLKVQQLVRSKYNQFFH
ncbi:hypothetical protein P256_02158 [Acinetobacter nectaris CIP 110549]|uniref:Uncharacterized protein n=1 Tax=Acinetobacter nectaris CIP 110549 TaxID=1392540 RepID=V2T5L3_9GAMM|nr:hypothetical protein [Acinetobacter nectaris]ESK37723.1 hypothetical protein P256_02158 [Acinetobacter nectaris CIP 110549]MCF9045206.1 hypothetical protein [Acinetobacter nectaris]